jgi:multicomponent Na+:H+ antiporter subunit E
MTGRRTVHPATPARRRFQPLAVLAGTAVWVLLWGNLTVANVLAGLVVAGAIVTAFPLPRLDTGVRLHLWSFLVLAVRFAADLVVSSIDVAWRTVRPGRMPRNSLVCVQLRSRNELFLTLTSDLVTLIPGSVSLELDALSGRLLLHVLGAETPADCERVRASVLAQEERVVRALADRDGQRVLDDRGAGVAS